MATFDVNQNLKKKSLSNLLSEGEAMDMGTEEMEDEGDETTSLLDTLREDGEGGMEPPTSAIDVGGGMASSAAVRDRKPLTQKVMDIQKSVDQMKFGQTPEERAAGIKRQMEDISRSADAYQKAELNRKGKDGLSIMDQIGAAQRKLEALESERAGTIQANQWGQIAEQFGNALTQTMAGMYGLKHNVNVSGLQFNRSNWEDRLKILLADVNDRMDRTLKSQIEGQQLAQKVGETAHTMAEGRRKQVMESASKEEMATAKKKEDTLKALLGAAGKEAEIEARGVEGGKNRELARELAGQKMGAQEKIALAKLNASRAEVGLEPLTNLPGALSRGPAPMAMKPVAPSSPAPTAVTEPTPATPEVASEPTPKIPATSTPAAQEVVEPLNLKMKDGATKTLTPLSTVFSSTMPTVPAERKAYLAARGAARAEYDKVGGDSASNDSLRRMQLVIDELRHPKNADITGTNKDRAAAVVKPFSLWGLGDVYEKASESGRDRMVALKGRMKAAVLPGLKATFGGQNISNAEREALTDTIWENRLPPNEIADKIEIFMNQVKANRNMMTMNPEANAKFDAETVKESERFIKKLDEPEASASSSSGKSLWEKLTAGEPDRSTSKYLRDAEESKLRKRLYELSKEKK